MKKIILFFILTLNFSLVSCWYKTHPPKQPTPTRASIPTPIPTPICDNNNSLESGICEGNCIDGKGTIIYPNKASYKGDFKNSVFNGKGLFTYCDGSIYDGQWVDGKRTGQGIYTSSNKKITQGECLDDNFLG